MAKKRLECRFTEEQYSYILALAEQFDQSPQEVLRVLVDACIKRDSYDSNQHF